MMKEPELQKTATSIIQPSLKSFAYCIIQTSFMAPNFLKTTKQVSGKPTFIWQNLSIELFILITQGQK